MPQKKPHLDQLEQPVMAAFGVQPDWYEEYWLSSSKAFPSIGGRWRRSNLLSRLILYATIVSVFVYFGH
jgi:hypothetical protein